MAVLLAASSFFVGAYTLLLYTSCQHGAPPSFCNPRHLFSPVNYIILLLHLFPLVVPMLRANMFIIY